MFSQLMSIKSRATPMYPCPQNICCFKYHSQELRNIQVHFVRFNTRVTPIHYSPLCMAERQTLGQLLQDPLLQAASTMPLVL